jgi:transposase
VLSLPPTVRVFVAVEPVDMRGSFDALAGAVRRLGLDPVDGHLYLFLNRRRRLAKSIWFDGSGWCVLAKRLEAGSFQLPRVDGNASQVSIDGSTFASLLAGIDFTAARRGWYRRPTESARKAIKTIDMDCQV